MTDEETTEEEVKPTLEDKIREMLASMPGLDSELLTGKVMAVLHAHEEEVKPEVPQPDPVPKADSTPPKPDSVKPEVPRPDSKPPKSEPEPKPDSVKPEAEATEAPEATEESGTSDSDDNDDKDKADESETEEKSEATKDDAKAE